jgi:hypothetical protein
MLQTILILASAAGESEPSKAPFYIAGGVLAAWALALFGLGMRNQTFPESTLVERGVIAVTAVLVAATMAAAVATG